MSVAERFSANLLAARTATGLSQEEVGFRAGLHRTEVSQLERGPRVPRIDTLAKLCAALGVEAAVLMAGIRWKPPAVMGGGFEEGINQTHPKPSEAR
ncbi:MAG TPA: helix-turn-helix transcriptional regulator [Solirubrobacterales bacterium]